MQGRRGLRLWIRFEDGLEGSVSLGNLLEIAEMVTVCALERKSRGGHARDDYPKRDDVNWLKHSLAWVQEDGKIKLGYKPVTITKFQPKERVY